MNKLGFALAVTNEGMGIANQINASAGEWIRQIDDIRGVISNLEWPNHSEFATILSFNQHGSFVILVRPLAGRGGDNLAAWVYIPNSVQISGEQLVGVLQKVKAATINDSTDYVALQNIFKESYNELPYHMPNNIDPARSRVGRIDSQYSLAELLNGDIYQDEYAQYKYLIYLDPGQAIVAGQFVEVMNLGVKKSYCVAHRPVDMNNISDILYDNGNKRFESPLRIEKGRSLPLTCKRNGYDDIELMHEVKNSGPLVIDIMPEKWHKKISSNMFQIIDKETKKNIRGASIYINGQSVERVGSIPESRLKGVSVRVVANGYSEFEKSVDLTEQSVNISMTKKPRSQKARPNNSGNSNSGDKTTLILKSIIVFLLFLLFLLIILKCIDFGSKEGQGKEGHKTEMTEEKAEAHNDSLVLVAVKYIDTEKIWHRDIMENIDKLKDAWDVLSSRNKDAIINLHMSLDSKSGRLKAVIDAMKDDVEYGNHTDPEIDASNYVNEINKKNESNKGAKSSSKKSL